MTTIPVQDAEGREPLPICWRNRDWLIDHYRSGEAIILRFASYCPWCGTKLPDRPFRDD
jgi:hypothetical protein